MDSERTTREQEARTVHIITFLALNTRTTTNRDNIDVACAKTNETLAVQFVWVRASDPSPKLYRRF